MELERFYQTIDNSQPLYPSEVSDMKTLVEEYPYFQQAIFLYLRALYKLNNHSYADELRRLSIFVNDRKALFFFIFDDEYKTLLEKSGKKELDEDKTATLLNAFFEVAGDDLLLPDMGSTLGLSLASNDYFSFVNLEDTDKSGVPLKHQNIIDSFMERSAEDGVRIHIDREQLKQPYTEVVEKGEDEILESDIFFTETLAKIYIKQKRYDKAYKIIKHLSLNYPKKNLYFADQLSFLEKLIINSKYKDKK